MKKKYSKKQLAQLIIDANPDIFIPLESLVEDLDSIYKIRKIAVKILNKEEYCISLLRNLLIIANNAFGKNKNILINIVLSDDEIKAVQKVLNDTKT